MINWCAYCQEFQGEVPPFDNFGLSHGMCANCEKKGLDITDERIDFIQSLKQLQLKLWSAGKHESRESVEALVDEAMRYDLRPVDVLIGLLAPLLYQIGEDWARGKITVADEHRFTAFAFNVLHTVETKMKFSPMVDRSDKPQVLLVNADGNSHSLGIQIVEIFLRSAGISVRAIFPGLPGAEIVKLSKELKPKWIGISVSLADQIPALIQTVEEVLKVYPAAENKIFLGGYAVKTGLVPALNGTIQTPELGSLVSLLRVL